MDDHGPDLPGADADLAADLERWAAEARVDDAARQRTRERWLRQQAEEEGTLVGVLCDLAERGTPVAVRTCAGRQHRGRVHAVGHDYVAIASGPGPVRAGVPGSSRASGSAGAPGSAGPVAFVALAAVSSLRTQPEPAPPTGDRPVRANGRLAEVLADLAAERERVLIVSRDPGDAVVGSLRSVGRDLAVVRLDGPEAAAAYVPLAAVAEVVVGT